MSQTQANAAEIERWNDTTGKTWARFQVELDRQVGPIGAKAQDALFALLSSSPTRRILDVGCGAGDTTMRIAAALGPTDAILGVDLSGPMLEIARSRHRPSSSAAVSFVQADAQVYAFERESLDGLFSRFGVMFFDDPQGAFSNLGRAARSGAPLAFCCWRSLAENPWLSLPVDAASFVPQPPPSEPNAPGPFAFADSERVRRILEAAGWTQVRFEPLDLAIGGSDLDATAAMFTRVGPLGSALRLCAADDALKARAEAAVREALVAYETPQGVFIDSASWIVTARRG
jgi:SAM-dependent methyltransferase